MSSDNAFAVTPKITSATISVANLPASWKDTYFRFWSQVASLFQFTYIVNVYFSGLLSQSIDVFAQLLTNIVHDRNIWLYSSAGIPRNQFSPIYPPSGTFLEEWVLADNWITRQGHHINSFIVVEVGKVLDHNLLHRVKIQGKEIWSPPSIESGQGESFVLVGASISVIVGSRLLLPSTYLKISSTSKQYDSELKNKLFVFPYNKDGFGPGMPRTFQ